MAEPTRVSVPIHFGPFEVSPDSGELRKNGTRLKLTGQAIQVLLALLERPGQLVTREELQEKLWPGASFGDFEHGINAVIKRLRDVLGDSATQPKFIETIPRRGYRFVGAVVSSRPKPVGGTEKPEPNIITRKLRFVFVALLIVVCVGVIFWAARFRRKELTYTQITSFTDSAVAPALSPDGRMVAFYKSDNWFLTPDQIYVKMLPNGDPVQLTNDPRLKIPAGIFPRRFTHRIHHL